MSTSHLVAFPTPGAPESPGEKIRRLQIEARALAHQHMEQLGAALGEVGRLSEEIYEGGELYPIGARELARRLTEESARHTFLLTGLIERT